MIIALSGLLRTADAQAEPATGTNRPETAAATIAATTQQAAPAKKVEQRPAYDTYTVRTGDTLWGIAEQHLGDPAQWPRIYELSCTIRQPDGNLLSHPDRITPGWTLRLPATKGSAPHSDQSARKREPRTPPEAQDPYNGARQQGDKDRDAGKADGHSSQQAAARAEGSERTRPVTVSVGAASAIGVTTAASVAAAVAFARRHAARRRSLSPTSLGESPDGHDDLTLNDALERSNRAHLSARAAHHHSTELPRRTPPADPMPPGSVAIAEKDGCELGIETLAVAGGAHLTGPGADSAARHLIVAVTGATQRLRPSKPRLQLVSTWTTVSRLLPDLVVPPPALTIEESWGDALAAVESRLVGQARRVDELFAPRPDTAADTDADAWHILLVDTQLSVPAELTALASRATPGSLAVITLGENSRAGSWVSVAEDGAVTSNLPVLDGASMFRLADRTAPEFIDLMHASHGHPHARDDGPLDPDAPAESRAPETPHQAPTLPPEPVRPARTRALHIQLFGGFKLFVRDEECSLIETRKEETREFIALLATHKDGLRGEEIAEKMQLADDPDVAKGEIENLRRAARRVFRSATGMKEVAFVVLNGRVHKLDPQYVTTDAAEFTEAVTEAATADSSSERAIALERAAEAYRGPLCDGAHYLWAHGPRAAFHRRALDALTLLADHALQRSADPEPALALLNRAADLDPENEGIYRRIIQLQLDLGRDDAAQRTFALLAERLEQIDAQPEPATRALLSREPARNEPSRRAVVSRVSPKAFRTS
ncbi:BTAD domain-containing putative transcriptional regulator [Streptomyces triticagri]|nr:BTAD domain-containing putative transcriptional regulator [Streptomyces triticagri]